MELHTRILAFLILGLISISSGQKTIKRLRPFSALQAKQHLFIPPILIRPTLPPSPPPTVDVQQAEVQSGEFFTSHDFQSVTQATPQYQTKPPPQTYQSSPQTYQSSPQTYQSSPQTYQSSPQTYQSSTQPPVLPEQKSRNQFRRSNVPGKPVVTPIPIISLNKQQSLDGSYKTSYETANSIQAEETGFVKNLGIPDHEALVQFGSYSYTDPDGKLVSVTYTADEGGFRATGDHLPTPPPIPPEVQKGLDIIYESIRLEAERKSKEKSLKKQKQESQNYPIDNHESSGTGHSHTRRH